MPQLKRDYNCPVCSHCWTLEPIRTRQRREDKSSIAEQLRDILEAESDPYDCDLELPWDMDYDGCDCEWDWWIRYDVTWCDEHEYTEEESEPNDNTQDMAK